VGYRPTSGLQACTSLEATVNLRTPTRPPCPHRHLVIRPLRVPHHLLQLLVVQPDVNRYRQPPTRLPHPLRLLVIRPPRPSQLLVVQPLRLLQLHEVTRARQPHLPYPVSAPQSVAAAKNNVCMMLGRTAPCAPVVLPSSDAATGSNEGAQPQQRHPLSSPATPLSKLARPPHPHPPSLSSVVRPAVQPPPLSKPARPPHPNKWPRLHLCRHLCHCSCRPNSR
jgi:hypothetical protein